MPRQDRIHDLWHDRILITYDAGENRPVLAQLLGQILPQFVLHVPRFEKWFGKWTVAQLAERPRQTHDRKNPHGKPPFWLRLYPHSRRTSWHNASHRLASS